MKKIILFTMTIIWIVFIFLNSLQTGAESAGASGRIVSIVSDFFNWLNIDIPFKVLSTWIRKLAHVFEYFVLALLITQNIFESNILPKYKYIYSLALPLLIAILDEFIQTLVPGRAGTIIDVLIDMIGVITGVVFISIFSIKRYRIKK